MGRGNHAHIALDSSMATYAVKLPVRQHTQQARLQIKGHISNFIQEERSALCLFKPATALRLSARKGSPLMAEQFRLQQVLGNCGRVDRYKGAA